MAYYDGTRLLSMLDLDGNRPEIYLCTTNRTGGKTTWFGKRMVEGFLQRGEKFMLLYRYSYELDQVADKFFKDIGPLFFRGHEMESAKRSKGIYHELFLDGESCGYAVALNCADSVKKISHLLSDTSCMLLDEFQSETGHYCKDEVAKLMSVHTSVARGKNKQVRYVPVYMLSNAVTLLNPYYTALGVCDRLRADTKFLRGHGWVLEQGHVESAAKAQAESAFNRAFSSEQYAAYSAQNVYLNDSTAFIGTPHGKSSYLCTLRYDGCDYGVREYREAGVIYCDRRPDASFPTRVSVTTDDHRVNYVMLRSNTAILGALRWYFDNGAFRFKDQRCKEAVLRALSL